ncbi:Os11g0283766 [Oryza sativa Japonica Group]|uniref:Os11g0283766 protein n=1 Tax=Oryza sativa subsp. japonica TaxID=39947 RepID=A0A0P0Y218_ORYSJ|nr:Os11g0283766 [Oryza sativa Japonica Group]
MDALTPPCFRVSTGLPLQSTSPDELLITSYRIIEIPIWHPLVRIADAGGDGVIKPLKKNEEAVSNGEIGQEVLQGSGSHGVHSNSTGWI